MRRTELLAVLVLLLAACQSTAEDAAPTRTPSTSTAVSPTGSPPPETAALQLGNDRPRTTIRVKDSTELAGNRVGDMFELEHHPLPCPSARADWQYAHVVDLGFTWARISLDPGEWERLRRPGQFSKRTSIDPCQDRIITALADSGVTIVLTIVYWDRDMHADHPPDYGRERDVRAYLDHARFLVHHFKDRVRYYEILNEAIAFVELRDYLNLLRRVVPVIHEEYPGARVVANPTSDILAPFDAHYLFGFLRSDLPPSLGAIATHPLYGASPAYEEARLLYEGYPALARRIKAVASEHGFTGQYLTEEMLWRTPENRLKSEPLTYTELEATKYFLRAIVLHRGMGFWAGIGGRMYDTIPSFVEAAPRLSTVLDGARPVRSSVRIESQAEDIASYGFALPNGDRMLALWTDGVAVDEDPGVPTTLTFVGQLSQRTIGTDVLEGLEQELVTQREGEGVIVRDVLVKDYPIFVRLAS